MENQETTSILTPMRFTLGAFSQAMPLCKITPLRINTMNIKCKQDQKILKFYDLNVVQSWSKICRVKENTEKFDKKHIICNKDINQ